MIRYTIVALFSVILIACGEENLNPSVHKPVSIGTQGEVTIIMADQMWDGKVGEYVRQYIAPELTYYPQPENLFDIKHYTKSTFEKGSKRQKNILQFEITDHTEIESGINYLKDVWASDQVVIKLVAKSQQELAQLFVNNGQDIQDYLVDQEMKRINAQIDQNKNHLVGKTLEETHKLSVRVPQDMELLINNDSFVALERKRLRTESGSAGDIQQYLIIYHYPYTDDSTFTKSFQVEKRDSIVKKYFKGQVEGSYMVTSPDSISPVFVRERIFKSEYAFEMRGLYRMEGGDFRGGPFLSVSLVDEKNNRVVTIEGQVFAPKFNKREFMLELETMINSLSFY